jgi:hypothetical protein
MNKGEQNLWQGIDPLEAQSVRAIIVPCLSRRSLLNEVLRPANC